MQSLGWYAKRLSAMSAAEITWRLRGRWQDALDGRRARRGTLGRRVQDMRNGTPLRTDGPCAVLPPGLEDAVDHAAPEEMELWKKKVTIEADLLLRNHIRLFDLADVDLGDPIHWNREYKAGKDAPMSFAGTIDYRDRNVTGDCKFVWELNRHHQLVVLGRAYRLTADQSYAVKVTELLDSWLKQCPYGMGMNWRSPLELAIRLINWTWALELIRPAAVISQELGRRLDVSVSQHVHEITRKYSRYSSANNHLIGEAAGVFVGASCLLHGARASRMREEAQRILSEQILAQTYADGGTREQAAGYHLFVVQFFLICGLIARRRGHDFGAAYWDRLERMFDFLNGLSEGGCGPPMFGDADDGYVLDLGGSEDIVHSYLGIGAILFNRADFGAPAEGFGEPAFWLLGSEGRDRYHRMNGHGASREIRSRALPDSGYYLLQRGHVDDPDRVSVVFDCGELGFQAIAAHGHADALSFTLRLSGADVLVDPGTYDYFTYPDWRSHFRGTSAHNTAVIDGQDQSQMLGRFMWGRKAKALCRAWEPTRRGGLVTGEHDGYSTLKDPVLHRRSLELSDDEPMLLVRDEIVARKDHRVQLVWHFAEHCKLESLGENRFAVDFGGGTVTMESPSQTDIEVVRGGEETKLGWVSRGYHRKAPSTTVVASCRTRGTVLLTTRFTWDRPIGAQA